MILRIFDCRSGLLISLLEILQVLLSRLPHLKTQNWTVERVIAHHGIHAGNLEETFDSTGSVEVCLEELTEWLEQGQVFTSLKLHCPIEQIAIGVEDSTYLFIESHNQILIGDIGRKFERKQVVE